MGCCRCWRIRQCDWTFCSNARSDVDKCKFSTLNKHTHYSIFLSTFIHLFFLLDWGEVKGKSWLNLISNLNQHFSLCNLFPRQAKKEVFPYFTLKLLCFPIVLTSIDWERALRKLFSPQGWKNDEKLREGRRMRKEIHQRQSKFTSLAISLSSFCLLHKISSYFCQNCWCFCAKVVSSLVMACSMQENLFAVIQKAFSYIRRKSHTHTHHTFFCLSVSILLGIYQHRVTSPPITYLWLFLRP